MTYSCSKNTDKIYNCICDNTLSDKYMPYKNGDTIVYANDKETISFIVKIEKAQNYKDTICYDCKQEVCGNPCNSYMLIQNDSIEMILSFTMKIFSSVVCTFSNLYSDKYNVFVKKTSDSTFYQSNVCFASNNSIDIIEDKYWTHSPIFSVSKFFCINKDEILTKLDFGDKNWIDSKSVVQSMTITEGVGISRIEFECGEVWTIVQ